MSSLEKVVRSAAAGPSVFFRERAYADVERQALIRDVLGLANAMVDGPRYLILGVRDNGPAERALVGVADDEIAPAEERYREQIERYIEPELPIELHSLELDGSMLLILALNHCSEPPYLLKENLSNAMREGSGWILRAKEAARLRRPDLLQLFEKTILGPANQPAIEVGFAANGVVEELALAALDLAELPSRIAGNKFRNLIEAKQAAQDLAGNTTTRIERLVHAREFGDNQPFEQASQTGLMKRLDMAEEDHWEADEHYQFEIRAHKVNLGLVNVGDVDLQDGLLTLDFPRAEGMGISEFIRVAPGSRAEPPEGYPVVETQENRIRVQAKIDTVPRHSTVPAFQEPLRIWFREAARGQTLPVDYKLHARNLHSPVIGALRIHVNVR